MREDCSLDPGPDICSEPFPLRRALLVGLVGAMMAFASIAMAGMQDGADPITSGVKGEQVTEDPSPVLGYVVIDMRRPQFTFNPQFIDPEVPRAIVPMGYGLKIVMPDPTVDSGCNSPQKTSCSKACQGSGATLAACEVDIQWNEDGTTTRTLICTCALPGRQKANSPGVAGSFAVTSEIRMAVP